MHQPTSAAAVFHGAENKAMLWSALADTGAFSGTSPEMCRTVATSIEARMLEAVAAGSASTYDLTELNKRVLKDVLGDIAAAQSVPASGVQRAFARKEADIKDMVDGPRPRQMDFSDQQDAPMGGSMDRALQDAVNRRTAQVEASRAQHAGTRAEAEGWLGRKEREEREKAQEPIRRLKIAETLSGEETGAEPVPASAPVPGGRRVRFEDPPAQDGAAGAERFLGALKRGTAPGSIDGEGITAIVAALERIETTLRAIPPALRSIAPASRRIRSPPPPTPLSPPTSPLGAVDDDDEIDETGSVWRPLAS
jgi:hypothetical protein